MAILIYTTCYPQVLPYLADFYRSLRPQLGADTTLCLGLDGVREEEVFLVCGERFQADFCYAVQGDSPSMLRSRALQERLHVFDGVLLCDADDTLLPGRVQAGRAHLEQADLTAVSMAYVEKDLHPVNSFFHARWPIVLEQMNVFGFGNTTWRSEALAACLPAPADCIAMDWILASRAWLKGYTLAADERLLMNYRQYGGNTAGSLPPFNAAQIFKGLGIVKNHLEHMLAFTTGFSNDMQARYASRLKTVLVFEEMMLSPTTLHTYLHALNALSSPLVWWEWIAHHELETTWKA